jgi:hypothetical protein
VGTAKGSERAPKGRPVPTTLGREPRTRAVGYSHLGRLTLGVPGGQTATDARGLGGLAGVLYRYPPGHSVDVVPQVKRANELFDGPLA